MSIARFIGLIAALCVAGGFAFSASAEDGAAIPGGILDPAFPKADVYKETPKEADPGNVRACQVGKKYLGFLRERKYADMAALFADDAIFLDPLRKSEAGKLDIRTFYEKTVGPWAPKAIGVDFVGSGNECLFLMAVEGTVAGQRRYVLAGLDHFTLNEAGKIKRMIVFSRPAQTDVDMRPPEMAGRK
jgi:hypothetical protein